VAGMSLEDLDVLLVRLGSTAGLRAAEEELELALRRAGARVYAVRAERPRPVRTMALTDLTWAYAARRAAHELLTARRPPRAVIYSTVTAALLWRRPGAIVFDSPAAANRPGRHGVWQRPLERRRLREAPLLLPSSVGALAEASAALGGTLDTARAFVLPVPIAPAESDEHSAPPPLDPETNGHPATARPERDVDALTYAANPSKKGLDRVLDAWRRARRPGERLVVAGIDRERLRELGYAVPDEDVHVVGMLRPEEYRTVLRRARVFVCAPRREEYGLAQLEALAEGCQLVTAPAPGGYVALPLARTLDPRLVGEDLADGLRAALDTPRADYASRAAELMAPYTTDAVDRLVAEELLPRLLEAREI
jgi:glycosyltransferase involved in cell wall biosynthesis